MQPPPLAVSVVEAARLLSISARTVRAWIRSGRLRGVRLGRRVLLNYAELQRLIDAPNKNEPETATPASHAGVTTEIGRNN